NDVAGSVRIQERRPPELLHAIDRDGLEIREDTEQHVLECIEAEAIGQEHEKLLEPVRKRHPSLLVQDRAEHTLASHHRIVRSEMMLPAACGFRNAVRLNSSMLSIETAWKYAKTPNSMSWNASKLKPLVRNTKSCSSRSASGIHLFLFRIGPSIRWPRTIALSDLK